MLVTFFGRHGSELAAEDTTDLNAHLASCPACAAAVQFERAFDDRVAKAMLAVPVPAGLKSKLLDGISAQQGTWYRQKAYAFAGMAACLLLSIGGIVAWQSSQTPELSLPAIVADADQKEQDRAAHARAFLKQESIAFHPEKALDLNQVGAWGISEFQGKKVPTLFFFNSAKNAQATVYIVRDADFKWNKLSQDGSSFPSKYGYQVAVLKDTQRSDVGYIVVFTGPGLELFLENREAL
jgi:hypothetical protein